MKSFAHRSMSLLQEEDAASAVEYAVLLTLTVVILVAGLATIGVHPK